MHGRPRTDRQALLTLTLGLNFGTHDAAAAIVHNGTVVAAVEEERLNRIKNTKVFPEQAIRSCLDLAGAHPQDLDQAALFVDPKLHLLLAPSNLRYGTPASIGSLLSDLDKYRTRRRLPHMVRRSGLLPGHLPLLPVPHHRAHAASAYLTSPSTTPWSSPSTAAASTRPPRSTTAPAAG